MSTGSVRGAAIWAMAGQYVVFATQFVVSVVISRYFLSPSEVGLFSIALAAVMMIAVLQDFGITRYIAGLTTVTPEQTDTCTSVAILFGLAIVTVIGIAIFPIATAYHDTRLIPLLAILGASYLLTPFHMISTALMARDLDFRGLFAVNVASALTSAAVAITLAWNGWSAGALAWAMVAQALVRTLVAQALRPVRIPVPLRLRDARAVLNFGTGSAALIVIGAIGVRTPDLIIGGVLGFAAVGLFSRATALAAQLYTLLSGAVGSIFYPAFARIRDRGEPLGPPYLRVVAAYCAVTMPAMAGLSIAAVPLVRTLYGPQWAASADVLSYVALSEICFIALPLHMDLPILLGRMKTLIVLNILDSAGSVALLLLGARYGLEWAALSRIAYGLVWYAIYARLMHRLIGFGWSAMLGIYLKSAAVSLAAITPLVLAYAMWRPAAAMEFASLAALCGAGVLCWAIAMVAVRHPATDELKGLASALLAKRGSHLPG